MSEKRMTYRELATALRVQPSTIRRWTWESGLPFTACGKFRFYNLATVEAWLAEQHQQKLAHKAEMKRAA